MGTIVLVARLILAGVFATASVGKMFDLPGSRRSLAAFGIPKRAATIAGTILPLAELAVAIALIPESTARWGAVGGLVLLVIFMGGIGSAIARGVAPDCNCFGALHSAPAGPRALVRNGALAAIAAFVAARGPGNSLKGAEAGTAAALAAMVALALLAIAIRMSMQTRTLRWQTTQLQEALAAAPAGLPTGALAPEFAISSPSGATISLATLLAPGLPVALIFVEPGCGPSEALLGEFERWRTVLGERITIGLVGSGAIERYQQTGIWWLADALEADTGLAAEIEEVNRVHYAYRVRATPSAVIVRPGGIIASATVDGRPAIEALIRRAAAHTSERQHTSRQRIAV